MQIFQISFCGKVFIKKKIAKTHLLFGGTVVYVLALHIIIIIFWKPHFEFSLVPFWHIAFLWLCAVPSENRSVW